MRHITKVPRIKTWFCCEAFFIFALISTLPMHGVTSYKFKRRTLASVLAVNETTKRSQKRHISTVIGWTHSSNRHNDTNQTIISSSSSTASSTKASQEILQSMRLLYLSYYASLGALMPYLPVYFHSLGHSGSSIGFLGAVKPLTTFLVAPLWGILSDQSNNPVSILQFAFCSSLVLQLLVGLNSNLNYLIVTVFLAAILNAPVKSLIDNIVMSKLTSDEDRYQFGRMRLWGQIGFGAGSSLVGYLLSALSTADSIATTTHSLGKDPNAGATIVDTVRHWMETKLRPLKGYEWAFVVHAVLSIPVIFCIHAFRPEKTLHTVIAPKNRKQVVDREGGKDNTTNVMEGWRLLSRNSDAIIFFFLVFVIGTSSGCIENFAYVRVREVGGTGNNMGVLRLVSSLAGAPMFWSSGPITEALGTDIVLVLSLLAYVFRFFNYAWMKHAYHALPAEALRGLTFALFWSSGSMYAHKISPPGMKATMLLIMNAMYGGLGQSLGAIVGGKLQSKFGTVNTFIYSGIFDTCFVCALVVYLLSVRERAFSSPKVTCEQDAATFASK